MKASPPAYIRPRRRARLYAASFDVCRARAATTRRRLLGVAPHEDETGRFYRAQCIHYGIKPRSDKHKTKEVLLAHAKANGCYFEINASPDRLDLSDEHARMAKDAGVRIAVNTDAHSIAELDFMPAGINQARRGWLEPMDVLNALPLAKLRKALKR